MPPLTLALDGPRATLTLTDPERGNRLNAPFMAALAKAVARLEDAAPKVLTIRAEGPQFCVGGDIEEFTAADSFAAHIETTLPPAADLFARLAGLPCPIVTAIQGPAAGGGLGLALCGDVILAADAASFRAAYPAIGVSPDLGASWQVIRRAGPTFAAAFLMTNRRVDATEALAAGLVTETVPAADLPARTEQIAAALAAMPRASLAAIKRLVCNPGSTLTDHMARETAEILRCARTADAAEGIAAFAERRPPRFTDA